MLRVLTVVTLILAAPMLAAPAMAMGSGSAPPEPTARQLFEEGKSAIYAQEWDRGIKLMKRVLAKDSRNADANNYIGYAYRKKGDLKNAAAFYRVALQIDDKHKGALEYQGEMFLKMNDLGSAQKNLARLQTLCPNGCTEQAELARAIADYTAAQGQKSGS